MWGWVPGVLGWLWKTVGAQFLMDFLMKLSNELMNRANEYFEEKKKKKENKKRFEEVANETKKAQTPEERQAAANNSARNTP